MNRAQALALTSKIEATWNNGRSWPATRSDAWIEALEPLDEGTAGTAFARLRATHPELPSVAVFIQTVKSLNTIDGGSRHDVCGYCDDTGWVETQPYAIAAEVYTGNEPCGHCTAGSITRQSAMWANAKPRDFISGAEAARLIAARLPGAA